jgi:hypothetical protein
MPRHILIGSSHGQPVANDAPMKDFVCALVEIVVAERSTEQLFADQALTDCLWFVLMKNRSLHDFGGDPWPEASVAEAVRSHLGKLRAAKRN